jgi:hypothetical protein
MGVYGCVCVHFYANESARVSVFARGRECACLCACAHPTSLSNIFKARTELDALKLAMQKLNDAKQDVDVHGV